MSIKDAVKSAYKKFKERNWDSIYYLVDLHDTVFESSYNGNNVEELKMIPEAIKFLKKLCEFQETKIILWSSVSLEDQDKYIKLFENSIGKVYAFNNNPDYNSAFATNGSKYADFSQKPYFSIIVDDKAGFTKKDWKRLYKSVKTWRK
jgi:hypothetical protein